jgi:Flp pilus assembly protein CpaB
VSTAPPPPANRNPTYLIVAGVVVSVLGAVMVLVLVSRPSNITVPGATRAVVVAAHDLDAHAQIRTEDVKLVEYPIDLIPDRSFTSTGQTTGRFTVAPIPKGQAITEDIVAGTAQAATTAGVGVPSGEVAVVIPPSDARSLISGLVQNGDRIDILARNLPGQTNGQIATTFTNLTVQILSGAGQTGTAASGEWVVYLPLKKATELVYLLNNSQYTYVVRSRKDTGPEPDAPAVGRNEFNSTYNVH